MAEIISTTSVSQPDFLIIGAAKAATTSLAIMLREHPEVAFSKIKEPHFFSNPNVFSKGSSWYRSLFDHRRQGQVTGEASTSYSRIRRYPKVVRRIQRYLPDVKIIYLVRNPFDRIRSAYLERLSEPGFVDAHQSLSQAVLNIPEMLDASRHFEVYKAYRDRFPAENIQLIWFEELIAEPQRIFQELCDFLGIARHKPVSVAIPDSNSQESVIDRIEAVGRSTANIDLTWTDQARAHIEQQLGGDIEQLLRRYDKPADYWTFRG